MKKEFSFVQVKLPQIDLTGVSVLTDMEKSQVDCVDLWEKTFMPAAAPHLKAAPAGTPTYGLSLVEDLAKGSFHYFAAFPWTGAAPEGFKNMSAPEGSYIKCTLNSLQDIGPAYTALFEYVQKQSGIDFRPEAPSLEEYPAAFPQPETLYIYMPVKTVT